MLYFSLSTVILSQILNLQAQDWVLNADGTAPCDETFSVDPANNNDDPNTYATFTSDTRGQNSIISGDAGNGAPKWRMVSKEGDPLLDWPLILNVNTNQWQHDSNTGKSTLAISMRAMCELTSECDQFLSFSFGDNNYISFATDFDGAITTGNKWGIQIYPSCGSTTLATGDPSTFLSSITKSNAMTMWYDIRRVLAGGNLDNWHVISTRYNGENFPVTFIFVNDPNENTLSITFKSNTFPNGISCKYNTNIDTTKGLTWYMTPDWPNNADEIQLVRGFYLSGNTDYPKKPLKIDPCSDEWKEEMAEEVQRNELMRMIGIGHDKKYKDGALFIDILIVLFVAIGLIVMIKCICSGNSDGFKNKMLVASSSKEENNPLLNNKV